MAGLNIHNVKRVKARVSTPREDRFGSVYHVTHIDIECENGEQHQVTLFGKHHDIDELDAYRESQLQVYPFVELERPGE